MKPERQIEELAKLDGYKKFLSPLQSKDDPIPRGWSKKVGGWSCRTELPAYLHSHDALQPIIDGMDDTTRGIYHCKLVCMFGDYCGSLVLTATPSQKADAILKAYGKWED